MEQMVTSKENGGRLSERSTPQGTHPHLVETLWETVCPGLIICLICYCSSFLLGEDDNTFLIYLSASQDIYKEWHHTFFFSCSPDCYRLLESRNVQKKGSWKFNWSSSFPFANEGTEVQWGKATYSGQQNHRQTHVCDTATFAQRSCAS